MWDYSSNWSQRANDNDKHCLLSADIFWGYLFYARILNVPMYRFISNTLAQYKAEFSAAMVLFNLSQKK